MEHYRVAILGAGFSGICVGHHLKKAGIESFAIFEKADAVGGTWRENRYPGVACDVQSHLYSFSFDLNPDWTRAYSSGAEIWAYLEGCVDRFGLRPHLNLGCEAKTVRFQDGRWQIATASGRTVTADVVVSGLGGLHIPNHPKIDGLDSFAGRVFHSAEWDHDHDLTDRRVAVIGTGSSAVQVIPEIAKIARRVLVFQRTPAWVVPRFDGPISERTRRVFRRFPRLMRLYRWSILALRETFGVFYIRRDSRTHALAERMVRRYLVREIPDPELRARLTPDYALGCKRPCLSDDYFQTMQRDDVDLVTTDISRVEPDAIVTSDGERYPVDTIVTATGFQPFNIAKYVEFAGRDGLLLKDAFSDRIEAHRTMMIPGFPNLFLMLGPNSGLGHNSVILMIEAQTRYLMSCLEHMDQKGIRQLEPTPGASRRFNDRIQEDLKGTVFGGGCNAWYTDDQDRNFTLWPYGVLSYTRALWRVEPSEFRS